MPLDTIPPQPLTTTQIAEVRALIEEHGFLPMTNKALRLFAAIEFKNDSTEQTLRLKEMFTEAGYLPRSKALKLLEMAS
jgi:hypothetical protein